MTSPLFSPPLEERAFHACTAVCSGSLSLSPCLKTFGAFPVIANYLFSMQMRQVNFSGTY